MNSNYGYANFAKKANQSRSPGRKGQQPRSASPSTQPYVAAKPQSAPSASTSSGQRINMQRGYNASDALNPAYGPQPLVGPQQQKGVFGKTKDAVAGKAQYYGAKAKNTLAKAGRFIKNNKVGVGLAAAGALGAAGYGIARKMRSDKGKKRGQYSK